MFELNVPSITCDECAATIKRAVKGVDDGARCDVDIDAKKVRVESPYPVMDFVEALEEVGYTALVPRH